MSGPRGRASKIASGSATTPTSRLPADDLNAWLEGKARRRSLSELPKVVYRALLLVLHADRRAFLMVSSMQLAAAGVLGLQLAVGKYALDAVLAEQGDERAFSRVAVPLLALALVTAALGLITALAAQSQRLLNERVLKATWDRVLSVTDSVSLETFERPDFFEELHRVEVAAIQRPVDVARGVVGLVTGAAGVVVLTGVLVRVHPVLPVVLVVSAAALWAVTRRRSRHEYEFVRDQATVHRERNYLRWALMNRVLAKEVRAFDIAPTLRQRYEVRYERYLEGMSALVRKQLLLALVAAAISSLVLTATLLLLVFLVIGGSVTIAEAAVAAVAIRLLSGRVSSLMTGVGQLYESALFLQDLDSFSARRPAARRTPSHPSEVLSRLTVENASLTYPSADKPALRNVDLHIDAGEVIALVGENGSGKTTLAKLVAHLYRPTTGSILWNGQDTAEVDPRCLREQIAVIFQDFAQWELSAHDNIALGAAEGAEDRIAVLRAAERAGAAEFLQALPRGFETILSTSYTGGSQLSTGQWQRVALARALYRDASLVVLDEPSSALDPKAEAALFSRLREIVEGRSVLFISHRFSTVRSADRIYVLHEGEIVEQGNHESLMALDGHYAELFRLQAAAYLDLEAAAE